MCGIVAVTGRADAGDVLIHGLERLEYRGYDSAGLVLSDREAGLSRVRVAGKVRDLKESWNHTTKGHTGIAHTRWATHGPATEDNAHPHQAGPVYIVHNGIIENYRELRRTVLEKGAELSSQTDSEVIAWLFSQAMEESSDVEDAFLKTVQQLQGAFALAVLVEGHSDMVLGARKGAPLLAARSDGVTYLASDPLAIAGEADALIYLEDGDIAVITPDEVRVLDFQGQKVNRAETPAQLTPALAEKGRYRHFMEKEIHEQPEVVGRTLSAYLEHQTDSIRPIKGLDFNQYDRILIVACGTAAYAGQIAEYWFESIAGIPVEVDIASEFRYRDPALRPSDLAIVISQSGETADTLEALRLCKRNGLTTLAIVNTAHSTIAREADVVAPTQAGPEIGVASTKAFTCQLAVLASLTIRAAFERQKVNKSELSDWVGLLTSLPGSISEALKLDKTINGMGQQLVHIPTVLYLGRHQFFPLAMEGALKLKEISYIHAEGYAAGELKHGPIALIEEGVTVIVIAPHDDLFDKTVSSIEQVRARGASVIVLTDPKGGAILEGMVDTIIELPPTEKGVAAIMTAAVAIQYIAYYTAVHRGTDVDQPRNLAKSVTVE